MGWGWWLVRNCIRAVLVVYGILIPMCHYWLCVVVDEEDELREVMDWLEVTQLVGGV